MKPGHPWKIASTCTLLAAIVSLCFLRRPVTPPPPSTSNPRPTPPANAAFDARIPSPDKDRRSRTTGKRALPALPAGRPKDALIQEARLLFAQSEATRTRLLAQRRYPDNDVLLYVVEPPSTGEIQTVKARIADLRNEVPPDDLEAFDQRLATAIDDYDPYGETGRKVLHITNPGPEGRMSGMLIQTDDIESLHENFLNSASYKITARKGWISSHDGKPLERFSQLPLPQPD